MEGQGHFRKGSKNRQKNQQQQEMPLFEDTSGAGQGYAQYGGPQMMPPQQAPYGMNPQQQFPGANILADPMANMAMQYGQNLAGQGKELLEKNVDRYISVSKLKYYFAVDTTYVAKKLALLSFPFTHQEWGVQYQQDTPVAPRFDINAPDLYIPVMAYITYILFSGISLGILDKFSPEELGIQASSAFVWLAIEIALIMFSLYLVNVRTDLGTWDVVSFCGYKYFGMIVIMAAGLVFRSAGYWAALGYMSLSIAYFLVKTLRLKILPHTASTDDFTQGHGGKRRLYLTLAISFVQPVFMYFLTRHLVPGSS
uniref:protein YIF1B-B-like n=1 Tax=Styela clava TaxID=7725 RepID=UPI001939F63D|nr:protein YIF1B-B-like [Styela clava]